MQYLPSCVAIISFLIYLSSCSGDSKPEDYQPDPDAEYFVGGNVSGLKGQGLKVEVKGAVPIFINSNGLYQTNSRLKDGTYYEITVLTQPVDPYQTCKPITATGRITGEDVTSASIQCKTNSFTVGGSISGLVGSGLVLQLNGENNLDIDTDGPYRFNAEIDDQDDFVVTILQQPSNPNQTCSISSPSGSINNNDIVNIDVICAQSSALPLKVIGKDNNSDELILSNNGSNFLTVTEDGDYAFSAQMEPMTAYNVQVVKHPGAPLQNCVVTNGLGSTESGVPDNIEVNCSSTEIQPSSSDAAAWNRYFCTGPQNGPPCFHGGERLEIFTDISAACDELSVSDELNAFNWLCEQSNGKAVFKSTGLKLNRSMSDLLDFGRVMWKMNRLLVSGAENYSSPNEVWWSNPVFLQNQPATLDHTGAVYLVNQNVVGTYQITESEVSFVVMPGKQITIDSSTPNDPALIVEANDNRAINGVWLEGRFIGQTDSLRSIMINKTNSAVLWDVFSDNGTVSASMNNSFIHRLRATRAGAGLSLGGQNNVVYDLTSNNNTWGLEVKGEGNKFNKLTLINNFLGVYMRSHFNFLQMLTLANNTTGISIAGKEGNSFNNLAIINSEVGIEITDRPLGASPDRNYFRNVAVTDSDTGIFLDEQLKNPIEIDGQLMMGNNNQADCFVAKESSNPGLLDDINGDDDVNSGDCLPGNESDFGSVLDVGSLAQSFMGKVLVEDPENNSDTNGGALRTEIVDWLNFSSRFRAWGIDGSEFPNLDNRSTCVLRRSLCRIWDFSLAEVDSPIKNVNLVKLSGTEENSLRHRFVSQVVPEVSLLDAVEVFKDGIGDEDGVCESNEACIHISNIASDQGDMELETAGEFLDGDSLQGIILLKRKN